jgi:hypothetical protein
MVIGAGTKPAEHCRTPKRRRKFFLRFALTLTAALLRRV